ncbi:MAG: hypothetical protein GEU82_15220, partial [Luteitalea sp.]|nr:hypothetical protein [Luteitalea sp.]
MTHDGSTKLRIVTYNIHRCRGMDRRTRPDRVVAVLRNVAADVIALQEVIGAGPQGESQIENIGAALGMGWVMGAARQLRGHKFGNVVLSRFPIVNHATYDLSWKTCEQRCLQRVDVDVDALQASLLAGFPRQVVRRMIDDRKAAQHDVAELVAAQLPR